LEVWGPKFDVPHAHLEALFFLHEHLN